MTRTKKIFSSVLAGLIAICFILGISMRIKSCSSVNSEQFTWWTTSGDTAYYLDYSNNPVLNYISKNVELTSDNGSKKHISFKFTIPASTDAATQEFRSKISNKEYDDIMDVTMYDGSVADLYTHGIILNLTPYFEDEELMPNLSQYLKDNPQAASALKTPVTKEDGSIEMMYLQIPSVSDVLDDDQQAFGFQYRRDWIVKYGQQPEEFYDPMTDTAPTKNPKAGQSFAGSYTVNNDGTLRTDAPSQNTEVPDGANGDSWVDDVVFPSGHTYPKYISDWQWMFAIYEKAFTALGIKNSYMISQYYVGYNANGDLNSGFGGGGTLWYKDENNTCRFGMTDERNGFKAYLECMNFWYKQKWLDNNFNNNSSSPFYQIDLDEIGQGLIPMWMGNANLLGARIQESAKSSGTANDNNKTAVVYGAATPINDIPAYDGEVATQDYDKQVTPQAAAESLAKPADTMLRVPTCMFQNEQYNTGGVISVTAKDKDLTLLFSFIDYLFSDEGSTLMTMGLSEEQYKKVNDSYYEQYGLTGGAYKVLEDGTYQYCDLLEKNSNGIRTAMTGQRLFGLRCNSKITYSYPQTYKDSRHEWTKYKATGFIGSVINGQMTSAESEVIGNIKSSLQENYLYKNVYKFINGSWSLDKNWISFCSAVMNYSYKGANVQKGMDVYNAVFARMYAEQ